MFLSIITVNFNNRIGLYETLKSVAHQTCLDYEHIIIDGGSTDGSVDVIKSMMDDSGYSSHVSFWCSEKDEGVYNAMNKGLLHVNGDYILFLNSGDYFIDSDKIQEIISLGITEDIIYFDALCMFEKGTVTMQYPDFITPSFFYGKRTLNHQNTLIKAELHKKRPFNELYRIVADMDFFFEEIIMKDCSTRHVNFPIVFYNGVDGLSSKKENLNLRDAEMRNSVSSYLSGRFIRDLDYIYSLEEEIREYKYRWGGLLYRLKVILDKYSDIKKRILRTVA